MVMTSPRNFFGIAVGSISAIWRRFTSYAFLSRTKAPHSGYIASGYNLQPAGSSRDPALQVTSVNFQPHRLSVNSFDVFYIRMPPRMHHIHDLITRSSYNVPNAAMKDIERWGPHAVYSLSSGTKDTLEGSAYDPSAIDRFVLDPSFHQIHCDSTTDSRLTRGIKG